MTPSFVKWAGRQLRPWQDRIQARQRQQRLDRMLSIDPQLRAAHEARSRAIAGHKPVRHIDRQIRAMMNDLLRRAVH